MLGTARQMVIDGRRSGRRRVRILEAFPIDLTPADEEAPEPLDTKRLGRCLSALPERERAVLVLTFYDDRSADAVAAELGAFGRQRARDPSSRPRAAARLPGIRRRRGMTRASCTTPASTQDLLAYWLDELDGSEENRLDEHLFACAACSERLRTIASIGAAIRNELLRGDFGFVLPASFIRRLKDSGLRVREYNLEPGRQRELHGDANDDLVVAHMRAPLRDVRRLDLVIQDSVAGSMRVNDVAFDPAAGDVTMVPSVAFLRTLRNEQQRVRLVAVEGVEERVIADYTFNHYPS